MIVRFLKDFVSLVVNHCGTVSNGMSQSISCLSDTTFSSCPMLSSHFPHLEDLSLGSQGPWTFFLFFMKESVRNLEVWDSFESCSVLLK